jgi:integrase
MATINSYTIAQGKRWRVRYRTPDHKSTQKRGFKTKRDAELFAATVEVAKAKGEYVSPANARITIGELGPAWLDRKRGHVKPSTFDSRDKAWRIQVEPRWGTVPIGGIRPTSVQQWIADLSQGTEGAKRAGASTILQAHHVLSAILEDAVRDNLLARNPAKGVKLPRVRRKRPEYLTHRQVADLAAAAGDYEALVLTLAYTGLRWGEAIGLRVRDVDMLRRRAAVSENAVQVKGKIHVGTTKAHKNRTVPLPAFLLPYLARQCEGKSRDDLLFADGDGQYPLQPHTKSGWLDRAVVAAGIPRVTLHDLRHTSASLAVSAGANVKAVQRMLGHASAAMTLDIYADLFDDDLEAVAVALDEARSRESVAKMWPRDHG